MRTPAIRAFTLIELMVVVLIIGILVSVSAPSYVAFVRRSKTTEALQGLAAISRGAVAYFDGERTTRDGVQLPRQFPQSQGPDPFPTALRAAGGAKFNVPESTWDAPTWRALDFAMNEPHYFAYHFTSVGTGNDAGFTARAWGDLDGDGFPSMYELAGGVDDGGNAGKGAGIYAIRALE